MLLAAVDVLGFFLNFKGGPLVVTPGYWGAPKKFNREITGDNP